jgi:hypothetical protein
MGSKLFLNILPFALIYFAVVFACKIRDELLFFYLKPCGVVLKVFCVGRKMWIKPYFYSKYKLFPVKRTDLLFSVNIQKSYDSI